MEGMEGKGAIIGWYQLISDMRDAGVKPIAIWDQKGTREWKAAEVN
jgi:flap endonuclease-1